MHTDTSAPETAHTPDPGETIESSLRAQVLGPVRIWRDGVELDLGPRQQRCLFALLMARAGQQVACGRSSRSSGPATHRPAP